MKTSVIVNKEELLGLVIEHVKKNLYPNHTEVKYIHFTCNHKTKSLKAVVEVEIKN